MVYTTIVHIWILPGKEAELKAVLVSAKEIFLKVPGTLHLLGMQDPKDSTAFSIVERYETEEAHAAHLAHPHFKVFMGSLGPLLDSSRERQLVHYVEF
ncbi:hypothetical protein K438DRAFT_1579534 [Mycena galopus ATCC 62051]|nr:hypothetical protein K438DRAFT_1579534 [Mycena galopus ATCC 62051]